ncbi:MAG: hypothetical protein AAB438_03560 [Patescibacteria group bacterium]
MIKDKKTQAKFIETYTDDMMKVIDQNEGGVIRKIIQEQEEHEALKENFSPQSKRNRVFLIFSLFFILCAVGAFVFLFLKKDDGIVEIAPQFSPLIFTDKTKFLEIDKLSGEQIVEKIVNEANISELKPGGIHGVYLTLDKKIVGLSDFLKMIKSNLVFTADNFVSDNFLLGVTSRVTNIEVEQDPTKIAPPPTTRGGDLFILVKIRSFTDVFKEMRLWENKMFVDMHDFFSIPLTVDTSYLLTKSFEDDIIQNKNARVLRDKDANIVMMYVYADDNSIVIANTEESTREVIIRLVGSKVKK